jgi:Arc/MetJ-type ribon-helix-helix transcriptional regulator
MADKAISIRLDAEAQRALQRLTKDGASQSEAIRQAVLDAGRAAWLKQAEADAKRIGTDPAERALFTELREFFGEL